MRLPKISAVAAIAISVAACSTMKKSKTATAGEPTPPAATFVPKKSSNGVYAPGNEELVAIQVKYKDVTQATLTQGYAIYVGVCTNCHQPKSIYERSEKVWPGIIEDMAKEAQLSPAQKDAVYKYVMAIKATQPG